MKKIFIVLGLGVALICGAQRAPFTALNPTANNTNFVVDLNTSEYVLSATNDLRFMQSTNRSSTVAKYCAITIYSGPTNRVLWFNTSWKWLGTTNNPPTLIQTNKVGILALKSYGPSETNIIAAYAVQP